MPTPSRVEAPRRRSTGEPLPDRHLLYTAAVQHVALDLEHLEEIYGGGRRRRPTLLREDFCGTAALACGWAASAPDRHACAVDLHGPTLAWARRRRLPALGEAAARVTLFQADARVVTRPRVDVVTALNFSYNTHTKRQSAEAVGRSLRQQAVGRSLRRRIFNPRRRGDADQRCHS